MNQYVSLIINTLIVGGIIIGASLFFLLIFSFIKFKSKKNIGLYIYAFSSSMLIVLGSLGFFRESIAILENNYHQHNQNVDPASYVIPLVLFFGTLIGIFIAILVRYLIIQKNSHIHTEHHDHGHSDYIFNLRDIDNVKNKWSAILLILNHRFTESIALGMLLIQPGITEYRFPTEHIGFIIVFIAHIIFESIFIYHRQIEMGISRKNALLNSIIMKILIIPFMIVGGYILQAIPQNDGTNWILPMMFVIAGSIMVFVSVIELVPEFIDNKNMSAKTWFFVLVFFGLGMVFAVTLSALHSHEHDTGSHSETLLLNFMNIGV